MLIFLSHIRFYCNIFCYCSLSAHVYTFYVCTFFSMNEKENEFSSKKNFCGSFRKLKQFNYRFIIIYYEFPAIHDSNEHDLNVIFEETKRKKRNHYLN